jgi:cell division initiation protein
MRMTPLDVQSHHFETRFRGLDPDEVTAFLRLVAEDYEGLLRENEIQSDRIRRLESRIDELSAQEHLLKETLVSAQAMTAEMSQSAERQAELRLAEVEIRAEKILDASHRRAAGLAQDIREMQTLRTRLAESLRSAAETHLALLATLESEPDQEALLRGLGEGAIALLRAEPRLSRPPRETRDEHESDVSPSEPPETQDPVSSPVRAVDPMRAVELSWPTAPAPVESDAPADPHAVESESLSA